MAEIDCSVASSAVLDSDCHATNDRATMRENIDKYLKELGSLRYGYNGDGEMPPRPDALATLALLFDRDSGVAVDGLSEFAVMCIKETGLPVVVTKHGNRAATYSVPCGGVVRLTLSTPNKIALSPFKRLTFNVSSPDCADLAALKILVDNHLFDN